MGGKPQNDGGAHHAGDEGRQRNAGHPHAQHKDAQGIATDIDEVHQHRHPHGHRTVAGGAEDGRAGVVQRQKGVGDGRDGKIQHGGIHNVGGDGAKEKPQHGGTQQKAGRHNRHPQHRAQTDQLPGAAGSLIGLSGAQILAGDHRAAGGQSRKNVEDQVVDHVHQRDARDGSLSHTGDHDGIGHAHQHGQPLFHHQRPEQREQRTVGEQPLFGFHFSVSLFP